MICFGGVSALINYNLNSHTSTGIVGYARLIALIDAAITAALISVGNLAARWGYDMYKELNKARRLRACLPG
jgi:hypothetical protein